MALKLTNNATSRLATSLSNSATTVVLSSGDGAKFPSLSVGDWFPLTVLRADNTREIMYATARSGDVLTVTRAQEGTAAMAFEANDRAELRASAGVFASYLPINGGIINGDVRINGEFYSYHAANPGTGAVFLTSTGSRFLSTDGTNYYLPNGDLIVNNGKVWTASTFNPATKADLSGPSFTGPVTMNNGGEFTTATWHACAKLPQIGAIQWQKGGASYSFGYGVSNSTFYWFRSTADDATGVATYLLTLDSAGTLIATGNVAAYSDRKHKKNIRTIVDGLALVERLRGVRYVRKDDGSENIGVIAQEVVGVFPEVVGECADGMHVSYGNLVAPLIEAVKELAARVRTLEAK